MSLAALMPVKAALSRLQTENYCAYTAFRAGNEETVASSRHYTTNFYRHVFYARTNPFAIYALCYHTHTRTQSPPTYIHSLLLNSTFLTLSKNLLSLEKIVNIISYITSILYADEHRHVYKYNNQLRLIIICKTISCFCVHVLLFKLFS